MAELKKNSAPNIDYQKKTQYIENEMMQNLKYFAKKDKYSGKLATHVSTNRGHKKEHDKKLLEFKNSCCK